MVQKEALGGYAGIHVPWIDSNNNGERNDGEQAELNLYGEGTIIAIGGNAGEGGTAISGDAGGAGGGGAGAGIGGNGGQGGNSNPSSSLNFSTTIKNFLESGCDAGTAESCGIINIYNNITVIAYGGSGASGGIFTPQTGSSGTGAGGYPAAGIGGGGAGGGRWRS